MLVHDFARRHLTAGWISITLFIGLGIVLEVLHAFKVGFLLDVDHETRRLMWSLAHAHGTLLGILNVALAATAARLTRWPAERLSLVSRAMLAATVFVPGGFLLGGIDPTGGDPGIGILLVPPGGFLLFGVAALVSHAVATTREDG